MIEVTKEAQALINEYNQCNALNLFFYNNKGCEALIEKLYGISGFDRYAFISRNNAISYQLIDYVYNNLHGKEVKLEDGTIGTIYHPLTYSCRRETHRHTVAFKREGFRELAEDLQQAHPETIAVEVIVDNNPTLSHLYTINELTLVD